MTGDLKHQGGHASFRNGPTLAAPRGYVSPLRASGISRSTMFYDIGASAQPPHAALHKRGWLFLQSTININILILVLILKVMTLSLPI